VHLSGATNPFEPAYAEIGDFPVGAGDVRVTIHTWSRLGHIPNPPVWAFLSVTNNDTQMITTITPQR
jgi:hypothetical protein